MELGFLQETKSTLKALVVSSPRSLTIEALNRDFKSEMGYYIPYKKLGYSNLELFLKSLTDTLVITGHGQFATVGFVTNEKIQHIADLVGGQRNATVRGRATGHFQKFSGKANSVNTIKEENWRIRPNPENNRSTSNTYISLEGKNPINFWNPTINGTESHKASSRPNEMFHRTGAVPKSSIYNGSSPGGDLKSKDSDAAIPKFVALIRNMSINNRQGAQTMYSPNTNNKICNEQNYQPNLKATLNGTSSASSKTDSKPKECSQNMRYLNESSDPIQGKDSKCDDTDSAIPSYTMNNKQGTMHTTDYSNRYNKICNGQNPQLESKEATTSLSSMSSKTDSNEAASKSKELSENNRCLNEFCGSLGEKDPDYDDCDSAIPSYAATHLVYQFDIPEGMVTFGQKIPCPEIPENITRESVIGVFVSEICNPFKFWIHIYKQNHELDDLMNRIEQYYQSLTPSEYVMLSYCIVPGQVCAATFNGWWHRGEILTEVQDNKAKVYFLDYGTVTEVSIDNIKYLPKRFAITPAQAVRACLSHVKPIYDKWQKGAIQEFFSLVSSKLLYAQVRDVDRKDNVLYLILCDTNGEENIQINSQLVNTGHAAFDFEWDEAMIKKLKL